MADFIQEHETPQPVTLWDKPDKFPAWRDCTFAQFLSHLRTVESKQGIVWHRADAYSMERGSEKRWTN